LKTSHQNAVLVATFAISLFSTDPAMANRLADAAVQGQSLVLTIAQATSVIGIAVGGILMSVGWGSAGKATLGGGVVGAFASIGAPAMISFVKEVFGS
jgi:hypothetical protein